MTNRTRDWVFDPPKDAAEWIEKLANDFTLMADGFIALGGHLGERGKEGAWNGHQGALGVAGFLRRAATDLREGRCPVCGPTKEKDEAVK
jgi:hypothetical protein